MARHTAASRGRGVGKEGYGGQGADVEGGNVLAPNPKKRRVRIPSILERERRQKQTKKKKSCKHRGFTFLAKKNKNSAIKKGGNKKVKL
jgi:hypothetical protein